MSPGAGKIFVNVMSFVLLLISWWIMGSFVAQKAVREDGQFFAANSPILAGSYFNDWLSVFAAGAFGLGWMIAMWISSMFRSRLQEFTAAILLISIPILFGLPIQIRLNTWDSSLPGELFKTLLLLFMFGSTIGLGMGQLRKFETGLHD
jgi:hypothetical protein